MRHFWLIIGNCTSRKVLWILAIISILTILSVIALAMMSMCYKWFYDALVAKDLAGSIKYILIYSSVMFLIAMCEAELHYRKRVFTFAVRANLYYHYNIHALDEARCQFSCQKMSQDLLQFGEQLINLFTALLHSLILIPAFIYIISPIITWKVILICCAISVIFSYISKLLGKPVVKYRYNQESLEGGLRRRLIEQIEKPRGEKILPDISYSQENFLKMALRERFLMYMKNIYDRMAHCIPYIVTMPKYFGGKMTLGEMVQTGTGLSKLITEISFFINYIDKIVEIMATVQRIKDLEYARQHNISELLDNKMH